jgi:hypothetical protein
MKALSSHALRDQGNGQEMRLICSHPRNAETKYLEEFAEAGFECFVEKINTGPQLSLDHWYHEVCEHG